MLSRTLPQVRITGNEALYRCQPTIKIYTDASAYCLGLIAYQNDQPILLRQRVLSPRAKDLYHTNTKELNGIAFAIETIRLLEIDCRVHFRYITIYTDNSAAQSIILNQRVSSVHGKQTVHLLKVLRYLQDITDYIYSTSSLLRTSLCWPQ